MRYTPSLPRPVAVALAATALTLAVGAASAHASYSIARVGTELQLTGDDASDKVVIDRDAGGAIRVDVGADGTFEDTSGSTIVNTTRVVVSAGGGDDEVTMNEANGPLIAATIAAGAGDDTVVSGSGNDLVSGGPGADVLTTKGGLDTVFGGPGADTLTGGDADDTVNGGEGDDTVIWNPGDDSDDVDGDDGNDLNVLNGGNGAEDFTLARNATATGVLSLSRVNPAPFTTDLLRVERIRVNENGGTDSFTAANNLAGLTQVVEVQPGAGGAQSVNGSDVSDVLIAGPDDTATFAGEEGDDTYSWSSGDGAGDTVDLGSGNDTVSVTGSDAPEQFRGEAAGATLRFTAITEGVTVDVPGAERLTLDAGGGNDVYTSFPTLTGQFAIDAAGGAGDDTLLGADGPETLRGGEGNDTITAGGGNDALFGDAGTDSLTGGAGADSFSCGGFGDTLDATPEDTVALDCLKPMDTPGTGGQPGGDQGTGLPAGFKGFSRPKISGKTGNLVVTVTNTYTAPITVRVAGTESASRAARMFRYRAVTKTVAPGARTKITLRAPSKLAALLKRNLARRGSIVRKPRVDVSNVATGGKTAVRSRIVVKARKK